MDTHNCCFNCKLVEHIDAGSKRSTQDQNPDYKVQPKLAKGPTSILNSDSTANSMVGSTPFFFSLLQNGVEENGRLREKKVDFFIFYF